MFLLRRLLFTAIFIVCEFAPGCSCGEEDDCTAPQQQQLQQLWEQGYGFNNPNAKKIREQIRTYKPPQRRR